MTRALTALARYTGRRGLVLAVIGLIWAFYGLGQILGGGAQLANPDEAIWHLTIDSVARGALWSATGVLALYTAVSRPVTDTPGFLALSVMPMVYTASYLTSWIVWALPLDDPGYTSGIVSACAWGSVLTLIAIVAGWPEPPVGSDDG